jgi:hypothetical protein
MAPGQPHLLAAGVERHRQSGHHPIAWADRIVLQEDPCFRVDECRSAAVAHRDPLGGSGGPGREDDPRVVRQQRVLHRSGVGVTGSRADHQVCGDDGSHGGLLEDQSGALVRVVVVGRHVRGTRHEDPEDRDVQVGRP